MSDIADIEDLIPEDTPDAKRREISIRLLKHNLKLLREQLNDQRDVMKDLSSTVANGGLVEIQKNQQKILDNVKEQTEINTETLKTFNKGLDVVRRIAFPVVTALSASGVLWFAKKLFMDWLF